MSAPTPQARPVINPIRTRSDWQAQRAACQQDPGAFHGAIARRELHWFDPAHRAWVTYDEAAARWTGYDDATGAPVTPDLPPDFSPWKRAFDDSDAPFYRWFAGAWTNACFNEVDRHVLAGHGEEVAFYFEGDRWDQSLDEGRGGPVVSFAVTRKQLLLETVKAAMVLQKLGLRAGDRIAINLPNIMEQIYFTEAAKRLGVIYTPVFGGFSAKTLSDRIHDSGARVVITSDGGYRNAQIVPYKEAYTDRR
jgi:3-hydroxypropionyl-CoA synthetase (EC 6.2.1.-)/3-hydroxypropionyl-CoA dehydratase (EC 4.2.1.-)/acrylyl-CoA reductase (NADPH) (EC 1.3.1.-)